MIRRSLRIGIRLGMLGGLAFAIFKIFQARRPLPAVPSGDDPWVTTPRAPTPASAAAPSRAPEPDEPALVQPTMLQSTSLKRSDTGTGTWDRSFDPASTAPPVVAPANPFTPTAAAPTLAPPITAEIAPDDDEIVILATGDSRAAPAPDAAAVEVTSAAAVGTPTASKKAAPRAGATKKAAAKSVTKKAGARKATTKKTGAKKAGAKKAGARKATTKKAGAKKAGAGGTAAWVEPEGGVCPTTHPVKAKLRSAIFHLPGMAAYTRTAPDRCYRDEEAATDDGLRKAAR